MSEVVTVASVAVTGQRGQPCKLVSARREGDDETGCHQVTLGKEWQPLYACLNSCCSLLSSLPVATCAQLHSSVMYVRAWQRELIAFSVLSAGRLAVSCDGYLACMFLSGVRGNGKGGRTGNGQKKDT